MKKITATINVVRFIADFSVIPRSVQVFIEAKTIATIKIAATKLAIAESAIFAILMFPPLFVK